jgi:hypothetical protein
MQRVYAQSDAKSLFCFGARSEPARWRIEGATGLLYSNAIGSFHGFIGKSVFYANIDADHRRLDRNGGNESLEHSLRFQLGCRFCGGMRKQLAPLTCASQHHSTASQRHVAGTRHTQRCFGIGPSQGAIAKRRC